MNLGNYKQGGKIELGKIFSWCWKSTQDRLIGIFGMLLTEKLVSTRIIVSLLIGAKAIAEPLLIIEDPSNPKIIDGVGAVSNGETLFILTQWLPDPKTTKDATYIIESRKAENLEDINWRRNLSELSEVRNMFDSVEAFFVGGSIWHALPGKNSLYLLLNRPAIVSAFPPMPSVLYRLDQKGNIIADRILELGEKGDLHFYLERIIDLELHARGVIVVFGYGITLLNDQDFSELTSWHFRKVGFDEPQHFNVILASHIDNNEMFLLGATIKKDDGNTPIWIKKLSLYPTLTLLDEIEVTTTDYYDIDKFNLVLSGDIIAVVGVDHRSNRIVCESIKLGEFSCEEIVFPQEISKTFNIRSHWRSISPSMIETSDGYMWTMKWSLSGILVGERSGNGIDIRHYKPQPSGHSFISEPYLFTMGNKEPFMLASQGRFFDGYMYPSVQVYKLDN